MTYTREDFNAQIDTSLADLELSTSAVAEWKLWRDIVVTFAIFFQGILSLFKKDVDDALANKQVGSLYWYGQIAREWQNGYSLQVTDGVVGYAVVDTAAQLIKRVSVRETPGGDMLVIKVAKEVDGALAPLSSGELTSFQNYLSARRFPGTKMNISSLPADTIYYELEVTFDPLYNEAEVAAAINASLLTFRNDFAFNAILYYNKMLEAVLSVPGVVDAALTFDIFGIADGISGGSYELPSGYFNFDSGSYLNLTAAA